MMLKYALIDLDDTLYGIESGLWPAIGERIESFMVQHLDLLPSEVPALRRRYFEKYGTTLNGLRAEQQVDPAAYLAYVHDLPLDQFLQPDPALEAMLARLPLTKVIFTNADAGHARRVTSRLGVSHHFQTTVDIEALEFVCKPEPRAYARMLEITGAQAGECVFVDDSLRNLIPAHAMGILTVLVRPGPRSGVPPGADYVIANILELERVLAETGRLPSVLAETA
jgi:putative hydrolase of the HAD superfamily